MTTDKNNIPVIELIDVSDFPRITSDGYYPVVITHAQWEHPKTNRARLWVKFEVRDGPGKGAWLQRRFYQTEKSIRSLSYLCAAVGISGNLNDPRHLIGKELIVLVNLKNHRKRGTLIPEPNLFVPLGETKGVLYEND
jgi:hypothetical protein